MTEQAAIPRPTNRADEIAVAWATVRALRHVVSNYPPLAANEHYRGALAEAEQEYSRLKKKRVIR